MSQWLEIFKGQPWWPSVVPWVLALVIAGIVGRAFYRAWPFIKKFVLTVISIDKLPDFMDRTDAAITGMKRQLENDHRTNMRDDITDAQETAKRVERGVASLHTKANSQARRIGKIETQITTLSAAESVANERITDIERTIPRNQLGQFTKKERENNGTQ